MATAAKKTANKTPWNERTVLTDHEVELMRQLHEEGYGYRRLAKIFEIHRMTVRDIVTYRHR